MAIDSERSHIHKFELRSITNTERGVFCLKFFDSISRSIYIILIRKYLFFFLHQRLHFLYNHQQPSRSARVSDSKWSPWESDPIFSDLKGGVGVVQELLEESLEPGSSLRGGLEGIIQTTVEIVTGGGREGSTIRFTTGYIKENVSVRLFRERAGSGDSYA